MKTFTTLAAGAAVLLALASPSLAASRSHNSDVNTVKTYGDQDIGNPPYQAGFGSYARGSSYYDNQENLGRQYNTSPGRNLPYPDRPYGDPDVD